MSETSAVYTTADVAAHFGTTNGRVRRYMRDCGIRVGSGARHGFTRSEFARLCKTLADNTPLIRASGTAPPEPADDEGGDSPADGFAENRAARPPPSTSPVSRSRPAESEQTRTAVGPGGRVVIPAAYRKVLGIKEGDAVFIRLDGEELRLVSDETEVRRVRELIARHVPEGVSLVDELIRDRRREAAAEGGE